MRASDDDYCSKQYAGYLERHDRGHTDADLDPGVGDIQDQLGERGLLIHYLVVCTNCALFF